MSEPAATDTSRILLKTPLGHVHHVAYRCRDAEQTRWFWEDILGFPLRMAMVFDEVPGEDGKRDYMHLFFEMGDGNFVAFFDSPTDDIDESTFRVRHGFDLHIAFECETMDELKAWRRRINGMGRPCFGPIDHGFVHSIYMYDPNGIQLEITVKDAAYAAITEAESKEVHALLADWTKATRAHNVAKFGAEALDLRGIDMSQVDLSGMKATLKSHHKPGR